MPSADPSLDHTREWPLELTGGRSILGDEQDVVRALLLVVGQEDEMYGYREIQQVAYGHYNDFIRTWQDITAICEKRGWPKPSVWTPTVGVGNEAIVETDYRDLASFQKAYEAFQSDAEAMKVYRGLAGIIVQGSSRSEIIEQVTKPLA